MSIVVALVNATVRVGGLPVSIRKGEAWSAGSPVVAAHPDLFSADESHAKGGTRAVEDRPVEQATRAPGEKSRARRAG